MDYGIRVGLVDIEMVAFVGELPQDLHRDLRSRMQDEKVLRGTLHYNNIQSIHNIGDIKSCRYSLSQVKGPLFDIVYLPPSFLISKFIACPLFRAAPDRSLAGKPRSGEW